MSAENTQLTGIRGDRRIWTMFETGTFLKGTAYHSRDELKKVENKSEEVKVKPKSTQEIIIGGGCAARMTGVIETTRRALEGDSINFERALFEPAGSNPDLPYHTTLQNTDTPSLLLTGEFFLITPVTQDAPPPTTPKELIQTTIKKLYQWKIVSPLKDLETTLNSISESIQAQRGSGDKNIVVNIPLTSDVIMIATILGQTTDTATITFNLGLTKEAYQRRKEAYPEHKRSYFKSKPLKTLENSNITSQDITGLKFYSSDAESLTILESKIVDGLWPEEAAVKEVLSKKGWGPAQDEQDRVLTELDLKAEGASQLVSVFRPIGEANLTDLVIIVDKRADKFTVRVHKSKAEKEASSERLDIKLLKEADKIFRGRLESSKKLVGEPTEMTPRKILESAFMNNKITDASRLNRLIPYAYAILQNVLADTNIPVRSMIQRQLDLYDPSMPGQTLENISYVDRKTGEDWQFWIGASADSGSIPELQIYLIQMKPTTEQNTVTKAMIDKIIAKVRPRL